MRKKEPISFFKANLEECSALLTIDRLDHFVMTCADVVETSAFYQRVLGMTEERFGPDGGRVALRFGNQKINLHPARFNDIDQLARVAMPGTEDVCFITDAAPEAVVAHLKSENVTITAGPVQRTGALGPMISVYFRDPDGNLVEVSSYEAA